MTSPAPVPADDDNGGWDALVGMTCTCPPGCTVGDTWGDGPRDCAIDCRPCRVRAGKPYVKRRKSKPPKPLGRAHVGVFDQPLVVDE